MLLRQSALLPDIVQAYISPDGTVITALVLRGPVRGNAQVGGLVPANLSVEQIAVSTGKPLAVLYRTRLGRTPEMNVGPDPLTLVPDAAGQHWLLNIGLSNGGWHAVFNGWLHDGRLLPLPPANGRETGEAW